MLQIATQDPSASALKQRCREIIDRFHHREALREEDIRGWVGEVVGVHGEAATWHAARASGFGGSDIGVLVRNFNGHRADHQVSAHDIVASKLLKSLPTEDSGDLRRGHENEPVHALKYYAKYAAKRDDVAFDTLTKSQGLRRWMRYSPDDVVLLAVDRPNPALGGAYARRLLIDYKAPRVVEEDDAIAFQYACQLHQGAMICAKAGVHLDGLMLSQYDWANWELKDDHVAYDASLSRLILQAGDHYFDYVMRGEIPPYIFTPKFDREQEFVEAMGEQAQRLAHLLAVSKAFKDASEALANDIRDHFKGVRLAGKRMQLGDLGVLGVSLPDHVKINALLSREAAAAVRKKGSEPAYDFAAMAAKLKEYGCDAMDYRVDKVDAEKAFAILADLGHDPEQLMTEQIRFTPAEHLKEAAQQLVRDSFPRDLAGSAANEDLAVVTAQENVREGQFAERPAPRTAMA